MSSGFSANQFNNAFKSQRLQNWCVSKSFKERPSAQKGRTTFIANDKGHLLPGAAKKGSAWPDFKGTWDFPDRIPTHPINPTSRSAEGLRRLKSWGLDPQQRRTQVAPPTQEAPPPTIGSAPELLGLPAPPVQTGGPSPSG